MSEVQMIDWHWRDTMRPARFIAFDARAALFVVIVLIRLFSPYTWGTFLLALIFFYVLEQMGLTFEAALRKMRSSLAGNERPAVIWTARRRLMDYGAGG